MALIEAIGKQLFFGGLSCSPMSVAKALTFYPFNIYHVACLPVANKLPRLLASNAVFRKYSHCGPFNIHQDSNVHETAQIGSFSVILDGVKVAPNVTIGSCCVIGPDVSIGAGTNIASNVTISNCSLGSNVNILPGTRIGQDGFGFTAGPDAANPLVKKPQMLRVVVGDNVEIGANCTIDRGSWRDTKIGDFTKLDNQVHIAHNAIIGRACLLAAQCGVAGSCSIGDGVQMGGQVGVAQHLTIPPGSRIAGKSGVMNSLKKSEDGLGVFGGVPAVPLRDWHRQSIFLRRIGRKRGNEHK